MEILTKIGKFENVNLIKLASVGYFDENKGENHVLIELSLGNDGCQRKLHCIFKTFGRSLIKRLTGTQHSIAGFYPLSHLSAYYIVAELVAY